jgi:hypothetical protein
VLVAKKRKEKRKPNKHIGLENVKRSIRTFQCSAWYQWQFGGFFELYIETSSRKMEPNVLSDREKDPVAARWGLWVFNTGSERHVTSSS